MEHRSSIDVEQDLSLQETDVRHRGKHTKHSMAESMREFAHGLNDDDTHRYGFDLNRDSDDEKEDDELLQSGKHGQIGLVSESEKQHLNGTRKSLFQLFKGFIACAILFLPKGFQEGGWVFSVAIILLSLLVNAVGILRLLECVEIKTGTYPQIGEIASGKLARTLVEITLCCSQIGFCIGYTTFVAENTRSISKYYGYDFPDFLNIVMQVVGMGLLCWVRRLGKLAFSHIYADLCLVFGVFVILAYAGIEIKDHGISSVRMFNSADFLSFFGTAIFTYEGIGICIPIYETMRHKKDFKYILWVVLVGLTIVLLIFGLLCYFAYGDGTKTVITLNSPKGTLVNVMVLLWMSSLFPTTPLQMAPAFRIIEGHLFSHLPKGQKRKWLKNLERMGLVLFTVLVGVFLGSKFDKIESIIGSICCTPLAFVFPSWFHLKMVKQTKQTKITNWIMIIFGVFIAFFTTGYTLSQMQTE